MGSFPAISLLTHMELDDLRAAGFISKFSEQHSLSEASVTYFSLHPVTHANL